MRILLALSLIVGLAYLGRVHLFRRSVTIGVYTGGIEFILIGALLGSGWLVSSPQDLLSDLFPFIHIELGWIGLLYGIQLDRKLLLRKSEADWMLLLIESSLTLVLIFVSAVIAFSYFITQFSNNQILTAAVVLAAAASLSSPWPAAILYNVIGKRNKEVNQLRFLSGLDDALGLAVFSALFFYPLPAFQQK